MKVRIDGAEAMAMYAAAFKRMRALPGFEMSKILRAETGTILKAWAGKTKVVTSAQVVEYRARYRAGKRAFGDVGSIDKNPYGISVNTGLRGGYPGEVWYRHPDSMKFQQAGVIRDNGTYVRPWTHFRDKAWERIQSGAELYAMNLVTQLKIGKESVGFARQSVVQIAEQLNIDLTMVPGAGISAAGIRKARKAIASNGRHYQNGIGTQGGDEVKFHVECMTRLPFGGKIGMDRELAGVIYRRARYIETSFRKGAMDSVKTAARAFPNVFRVMGSA
jgi:hypothetical protein